MPHVLVNDNESLESALRRFKRQCERSGYMAEIRKNRYFEKPSERRKRRMNAARRRQRKIQAMDN
ncbi:MAG: 30S ribosomal protein S21 [Gemmatimonadetes bacterium]|nr:MAG: 30S ribosomal protein S21 [Gemmatimonadota bacterium]